MVNLEKVVQEAAEWRERGDYDNIPTFSPDARSAIRTAVLEAPMIHRYVDEWIRRGLGPRIANERTLLRTLLVQAYCSVSGLVSERKSLGQLPFSETLTQRHKVACGQCGETTHDALLVSIRYSSRTEQAYLQFSETLLSNLRRHATQSRSRATDSFSAQGYTIEQVRAITGRETADLKRIYDSMAVMAREANKDLVAATIRLPRDPLDRIEYACVMGESRGIISARLGVATTSADEASTYAQVLRDELHKKSDIDVLGLHEEHSLLEEDGASLFSWNRIAIILKTGKLDIPMNLHVFSLPSMFLEEMSRAEYRQERHNRFVATPDIMRATLREGLLEATYEYP